MKLLSIETRSTLMTICAIKIHLMLVRNICYSWNLTEDFHVSERSLLAVYFLLTMTMDSEMMFLVSYSGCIRF